MKRERPVLVNSWEGAYFDFNADSVVEMAKVSKELGAETAELDAQCRVIPFYEKQGFAVCGGEHLDGHVPHRLMRRKL